MDLVALISQIPPSTVLLIVGAMLTLTIQILKGVYSRVKDKPDLDEREKAVVRFAPGAILVLTAVAQGLAAGTPSPQIISHVADAIAMALVAIGVHEATTKKRVPEPVSLEPPK